MRRLVDDKVLPCMQVLVSRHGKVAFNESYGTQNDGSAASLRAEGATSASGTHAATPLAPDTIHRIYRRTPLPGPRFRDAVCGLVVHCQTTNPQPCRCGALPRGRRTRLHGERSRPIARTV